jgi:quinohemoprotein ethanol dehydrogenase
VALDASSGEELWRQDTLIDRTRSYSITNAPQVANGKVIVGNAGAEFGVRGYVTAYDAISGEFAWRFYTVPGDPKLGFEHPELQQAAETWDPDSRWEFGGGGTVWGEMAYDPKLNLLYVGTGNSSPYPQWIRSPSGGDNLYLVSILAINPDTGRLVWHYQTTPGESWDFTATQNMILADLEIGGEDRSVLMQAPKNGFFYVLDRATGDLLSAEKYVTVTWASSVDMDTGRPVLTEQADYRDKPQLLFPHMGGGHDWQPMAYSPRQGLVYIPAMDVPNVYMMTPKQSFTLGDVNTISAGVEPSMLPDGDTYTDGVEMPANEVFLAYK